MKNYKAFISYKHGDDDALAASLEKSLEKFAKPTFKRRALEIFRDGNDLSAAADLGEKIRGGLENSEYIICMASPKYAASKWCVREAEYWRDNKSIDNFLIVLTDGEILWDESTNDFDWNVSTAIPKELSGAFKGEPFFIDFRDAGPKDKLTLDNPDFKNKLVLLAATLHGKSIGDMVGEAAKQHKRTMRIRNAAIGILSVLLLVSVFATINAINQRNKALLSNFLSSSKAQLSEDPTKSLRLAEHAYKYAKEKDLPTEEAAEQLIKVFYSGYGFYQEDTKSNIVYSTDEKAQQQYTHPFYSEIRQYTDAIYDEIDKRGGYASFTDDFYFDPETNTAMYLITSRTGLKSAFPKLYFFGKNYNYETTIDTVEVVLDEFLDYVAYMEDVAISKDGNYSILGAANSKIALIDNKIYKNESKINVFKDRAILNTSNEEPISRVTFSDDGDYIITEADVSEIVNEHRNVIDTLVNYWQIEPFPYIELINNPSEEGNYAIGESYYAKPKEGNTDSDFMFHGEHEVYDRNGNIIAVFPNSSHSHTTFINSDDNSYSANFLGVYNTEGDKLIKLNLFWIDNSLILYSFSNDNRFFKVSYPDGIERIFALDPEFIIERINDTEVMGNIATLSSEDRQRFLIN